MVRSPAVPAQSALAAWFAAERGRQEHLRAALGVTQPAVSGWARERGRPDPLFWEAIEWVTGIPRDDWRTDDERAQLAAIRARLGASVCTCPTCGHTHARRVDDPA